MVGQVGAGAAAAPPAVPTSAGLSYWPTADRLPSARGVPSGHLTTCAGMTKVLLERVPKKHRPANQSAALAHRPQADTGRRRPQFQPSTAGGREYFSESFVRSVRRRPPDRSTVRRSATITASIDWNRSFNPRGCVAPIGANTFIGNGTNTARYLPGHTEQALDQSVWGPYEGGPVPKFVRIAGRPPDNLSFTKGRHSFKFGEAVGGMLTVGILASPDNTSSENYKQNAPPQPGDLRPLVPQHLRVQWLLPQMTACCSRTEPSPTYRTLPGVVLPETIRISRKPRSIQPPAQKPVLTAITLITITMSLPKTIGRQLPV